jgi:phospholipid/cholesterol/gamma-HCH transport system permease protein
MPPVAFAHLIPAPLEALLYRVATAATSLFLAAFPSSWTRTNRDVLARQILFTGVDALPFVALLGFWIGVAAFVQIELVLSTLGRPAILGPILIAILFRELGPLLVNLVVIGRSGNAMAAEMAGMKVSGEVRALDAQGIDPLLYLVMPRVIAWIVSVFGLTVAFLAATLLSAFALLLLAGRSPLVLFELLDGMVAALRLADAVALTLKCTIPAALSAAIAVSEGLSAGDSPIEVPKATSRTMQSSVTLLFAVCGTLSALTYLLIL